MQMQSSRCRRAIVSLLCQVKAAAAGCDLQNLQARGRRGWGFTGQCRSRPVSSEPVQALPFLLLFPRGCQVPETEAEKGRGELCGREQRGYFNFFEFIFKIINVQCSLGCRRRTQ